ncbi:TOPRIM nucleotidyl transferase/hydrolase domain-containing protein [Streptomyces sp. NPDC003023]|uniref:TOPRIM nucleotidyl transferase/hydrolase domain-containing protein n=1 Tax=Streptomyces sp. NPDC003023 TaxID=3364675 RepID=UPI0036B171F4
MSMKRFGAALVAWAAGGPGAAAAAAAARELAADVGLRKVVLVEGSSDRAALEALAPRLGRDLGSEGVSVVGMGGAMSIGRYLELLGPRGLDVEPAGLCDAAEEHFFRRALERAGLGPHPDRAALERRGFQVCVADLEDELIRALGTDAVEEVLASQGDLRSFRTFQKQPAQRERDVDRQLRRFLGTMRGRKIHYGRTLVEALGPEATPQPLLGLLNGV